MSAAQPQPYDLARCSCSELLSLLPASVSPARASAEAIAAYASTLDVPRIRALGSSLAQDANFTKLESEFAPFVDADDDGKDSADTSLVNAEAALIVLLHALDFGGGWRLALHRHHSRGAWLTVKPGVEALYASCPQLTATWLESRTREDVAALFQLPTETHAELAPFVDQLTMVINEVGAGVQGSGFETLSQWLVGQLGTAAPPEATNCTAKCTEGGPAQTTVGESAKTASTAHAGTESAANGQQVAQEKTGATTATTANRHQQSYE